MKFGLADPAEASALIGTKVFVRTVTMNYTGRVVDLTDRWIVLEDCSWIADTGSGPSGRWATFLLKGIGDTSEVEPYPDGAVWVAMGAVLDISEWRHDLPRTQK